MRRKGQRRSRQGSAGEGNPGQVVETVGRRVRVRDAAGERVCFLSGHRAVIGDRVRWVEAKGSGGKVIAVEPRATQLRRLDITGREQVLAANLEGLLVVAAAQQPPFRAGLLDRYLVAAGANGLDVVVLLNKTDLGVPAEVRQALELRPDLVVHDVCAHEAAGLDPVRALLAEADGPWAMVGHSGVGKTSLIAALLPNQDVGPVGDLSEYWGTGTHTTTASRIFSVPTGGELADSPGIRTFTPGGISHVEMRLHFPGVSELRCRYRDCLHRPDEDGCVAEDTVPAVLLASYRRLLDDIANLEDKRRPGGRR